MQKALRNTSRKPTTAESLDKRDAARNKPSANPVIVVQTRKNRNLIDKLTEIMKQPPRPGQGRTMQDFRKSEGHRRV